MPNYLVLSAPLCVACDDIVILFKFFLFLNNKSYRLILNIAVTIVGKAVKFRHCPATVTEDERQRPLFWKRKEWEGG